VKPETLWNKLAGNWDKPGVSLGKDDIEHISRTQKYLDSRNTVLDYGCATGSIVFGLAGKVKAIYGLDISPKMIEIAKSKITANKTHNATFLCGDIFNGELKEESFDVITAFSILHLVKDPPRAFNRINQLLKTGGVFISVSPCMRKENATGLLIGLPAFALSKIGLLPTVNLFSQAGLADLITKADFQIIENERLGADSTINVLIAARKEGG
jgi:2-polyprenyl-3-methyl-5-hydroxy-6-metoxy-1,4-benzoquinol methylase